VVTIERIQASGALITLAALLLAADSRAQTQPLVIGNCVYHPRTTEGTVRTFVHTCLSSDNVREPIAVDCRTRQVARYLFEDFIIPGRPQRYAPGWQPFEAPDPNVDQQHALLIEAACP
jgi:hypothetical protein